MKAIVLYHSLYGNTRSVAESLAEGLRKAGIDTDCSSITEVEKSQIVTYDLIAIGSPTHILRPSKEMKAFLKELRSLDLRGKRGFSFDTRNESGMNKKSWSILENSAARGIEKALKKMGVEIIKSRESAPVIGQEGPLEHGVNHSFTQLGNEIGALLIS
jgi:flavodoxin